MEVAKKRENHNVYDFIQFRQQLTLASFENVCACMDWSAQAKFT